MLSLLDVIHVPVRQAWRRSAFRSLSTLSLIRPQPLIAPSFHLRRYPYTPSRTFSLGSLWPRTPAPTPTPEVYAQITRLEAEANVNPHDVAKQLAFLQALVDTKLPTSYELVISRWDKMCEFDPSSPLLRSPEAFQTYLACLLNTDKSGAVDEAVRKRDALLAAHPTLAPAATDPSVTTPETSKTDGAPVIQSPENVTPTPTLSSSQALAQAALARHSGSTPGNSPVLNTGNNAENPIQVTIVERKGAWIPRLLRFLAILAVSSFFFLVILSVMFENSGIMKAGPRQAQFEVTDGQVVKFSDVHGVDEAKEELKDIVEFLKNPEAFNGLGGRLPKGVLLTGSPGTGKTMLARAVAGEAGVPFFLASGSDFEEMFVGVGAKRVRELFAAARKKQPAIIFIDELDAVGGKRSSRDQQYMKQTLNQLLVEMDGFQSSENVIVIAATNFPQSLDSALVRPGRFDRIVAVPLPDVRGRVQILKHHMQKVRIADDVDVSILARGTSRFSGADLQNLINLAAIQASKEKALTVTLRHFEWAKDRIVMGAERKSQYIKDEDKLATAYHEGGHALVALYTEGAMPLHKVTCLPRGHALGYTSLLPEDDKFSMNFKQYRASLDVSMGGRVAEELIYGTEQVTSGATSDISSATNTARFMVTAAGFSKLGPINYENTSLSAHMQQEIESEVTRLIKESEARTTALLQSKIEELHKLATALVEHETLDGNEVRMIIQGEPLPSIEQVLEAELVKPDSPPEDS